MWFIQMMYLRWEENHPIKNSICDALGRGREKKKETLNSMSVRKQRGNRNRGSARNLPLTEPTSHRETKRNGKIGY